MLCEKCGLNPATVNMTQVINGQKSEYHLCAECAKEDELFKSISSTNFGFGSVFPSFLTESIPSAESGRVCPLCGTKLGEFLENGSFGCGECYITFEKEATPLLHKIHSIATHVGKRAKATNESAENKLDNLKRSLRDAVEREDYETAAKLRDEIKGFEKGEDDKR
ncbi:MAG: UvrB/UvrC motif-containing protein [Clostridia bacterium]|nr:UvrB/UvrC motif-containing protein [Clostridia bacterium]